MFVYMHVNKCNEKHFLSYLFSYRIYITQIILRASSKSTNFLSNFSREREREREREKFGEVKITIIIKCVRRSTVTFTPHGLLNNSLQSQQPLHSSCFFSRFRLQQCAEQKTIHRNSVRNNRTRETTRRPMALSNVFEDHRSEND